MLSRPAHWLLAMAAALAVSPSLAQAPAGAAKGAAPPPKIPRPQLFLKEEWKQTAAGGEHPVTTASIGNSDLELQLHVPTGEILLTGSPGDESNPTHVWTGMCMSPCAVTFRDKHRFVDLTGAARIRWNTKVSGFHQVHPVVKLADGTWLVGDRAEGATRDWMLSEIFYGDVRWLKLDIARVVTTGNIVDKVDLSKVDEIGFADLMPGSGHGPGGWSDVAQVEVYGKGVPR